jgi:hypothetical protein
LLEIVNSEREKQIKKEEFLKTLEGSDKNTKSLLLSPMGSNFEPSFQTVESLDLDPDSDSSEMLDPDPD